MYRILAAMIWLILAAPYAHSASAYLQLGGWSKHFQNNQVYNESHNTTGLEVEFDTKSGSTFGFLVSSFENSHWAESRHMALTAKHCYQPFPFSKACAGLSAGAIDGYRKIKGGGFFPALIPKLNFQYRKVGIDLLCVPAIHTTASFCAVQGRLYMGRF
ncbi:MAG: hypothetical protein KUG76_03455 [Gammaproteobacteria bacterium]|nr:hypothetical protein [Gammaproteobacteria bacterium]